MEFANCYACGSGRRRIVLHDATSGCSIARCRNCGAEYTYERLSRSDVLQRYREETYFTETSAASFDDAWLPDLRAQLGRIERMQPARGSLLDVGCGGGAFVFTAASNGWRAEGIDGSPKAIELARQKWSRGEFSVGDIEDDELSGNFDVITCFHVLEHTYDPLGLLRKFRALAQPSSLLVVGVPNFDSIDCRLDRRVRLETAHLPYHVAHFGPSSLAGALARAGWRVIDRFHAVPAVLARPLRHARRGTLGSEPRPDANAKPAGGPRRLKRAARELVTRLLPGTYLEYYARPLV